MRSIRWFLGLLLHTRLFCFLPCFFFSSLLLFSLYIKQGVSRSRSTRRRGVDHWWSDDSPKKRLFLHHLPLRFCVGEDGVTFMTAGLIVSQLRSQACQRVLSEPKRVVQTSLVLGSWSRREQQQDDDLSLSRRELLLDQSQPGVMIMRPFNM